MRTSRVVRQLRHGQITIPKEFRDALNLRDDDLLQITLGEGKIEVAPAKVQPAGKGSLWLGELYDMFEPVRKETNHYSEAAINAAIDEAIEAFRRDNSG